MTIGSSLKGYIERKPGNAFVMACGALMSVAALAIMVTTDSLAPVGLILAVSIGIGSYLGGQYVAQKLKVPALLVPIFGFSCFLIVSSGVIWSITGHPPIYWQVSQ